MILEIYTNDFRDFLTGYGEVIEASSSLHPHDFKYSNITLDLKFEKGTVLHFHNHGSSLSMGINCCRGSS